MPKLSPREMMIAIILGSALALWIIDSYAFTPYLAQRDALSAQKAEANEKLQKSNAMIHSRKANEAAWKRMQATGLNADPSVTESQMLHAVEDWARDARLFLQSEKRDRMEQDKQFGKIVIRATAVGTMAEVSRFLYDVQTSKLPTHVVDLQVNSRKDGTDDLSMTIGISTLVTGAVPTTGPTPAVASARKEMTE